MGAFEKILLAQETILHIQNHPIVCLKKKKEPEQIPELHPVKGENCF
jgi:hypothetical protein